jgi:hypothetical protein
MLNGTGAPRPDRGFTSYDFPSMNRTFTYTGKPEGDYPWAVNLPDPANQNSMPFNSAINTGPIGQSGVRIFDLTSNGTGLGLEVKVSTQANPIPFRVVLVRVR